MVFISRLKLRNFKSFKAADVQLPKTFICFAGPNGSGKSNLCDAIRFVMGETSLRSLRAKKVKDLIHADSRSAEVTIHFDGEGGSGYEIKRAIREDGKIRYRLNGKRTTRSAILEALRKHNLDGSGRNTIAQGEVQRIINMHGKERRLIIDSVAGIADFEEKKKEALHELETVETRIKDANLVLGERKAFLDELKREKEIALRYLDAKKTLTNAKGTMLKNELERLGKELGDLANLEEKIVFNKNNKEHEMAEIEAKIGEIEAKRMAISQELQTKQNTNKLIRRVEELKASCGSKTQLIEDREGLIKKLKAESENLANELSDEQGTIEAIKKDVDTLRSELKAGESRLAAQGNISENEGLTKIKRSLAGREEELISARETLIALSAEITSKNEIIEAKKAEEKNIREAVEEGNGNPTQEINKLRKEAAKMSEEIEQSFSKTKEINSEMADLDRQMLDLKEKASIFKIRTSPHLANPALSFVNDLKQKESGIYGTVADLITFEPKYANAVEASAGSRLLYVVVDSIDTATSVIERLKRAKCGRATFIPLETVRAPQSTRSNNGFSAVIETISFKEEVKRAIEYVFADTLLVDSVSDAKRIGVGSTRMVTLEGEIFERSGIISGGRSESGLLGANQLRKIEKELSDVKAKKESLLQQLYAIREDESKLRAEKSQVEIRIKTIEMESRIADEKRKEAEHNMKRKMQLHDEIAKLEESIKIRTADKEKLSVAIVEKEKGVATLREQLDLAEDTFRKQTEETSQKKADMSATVSSIRATIDGRMKELELRKKEYFLKEERLKQLERDEKTALQNINEVKRQLKNENDELAQMEEKISSTSKDIERLFEQMKGYEAQFTILGKKLAEKRMDADKLNKDLNQITVKTATATTHLEDINAEFSSYQNAEVLELKKEELVRLIEESEHILSDLGNVNMAAIEMYDKRKAEIEEAQQRIEKLDIERHAILSMIGEIEEHKKEAFFETFQAVSDNFSKMFQYIEIGEGYLYLDKPITPFESGLFIKIRRNNREYSLDALSGGEKTLVALMFIFALQFFKPAPFYILDEVDAALDKPNSKNLSELISKMTNDSQFIIVSHNDIIMSSSDSVIGVAKAGGASKLIGVKLKQVAAA